MREKGQSVKFMMMAVILGLMSGIVSEAAAKPLKVFILAGQSNMQGHAGVETFDYIGDDPATAPILKEMRGPDGKPVVCQKVWISYLERSGNLTAGFGASKSEIGPEFTFGIYRQKMLDEPILLIKTAWGGMKEILADYEGLRAELDKLYAVDKPLPVAASGAIDGEIIFAERNPGRDYQGHYYANFGYDCGNEKYWLHGADGGRLAILNRRTGEARTLIEDAGGAFRDPVVHYDGEKVLFSYRKGGTHHYNLYEINLRGGTALRQLTSGDWDDVEPAYLPDGGIVFCSTRCKRYVLCWLAPVAVLHRCNNDGSDIRQLSSGAVVENTPSILPDGRILYTRWEYVDRDAVSFHHLWVMNPDGTGASTYYGNMHPGGAFTDAQPIPGSDKVVYVDSGYHGSPEHTGTFLILNVKNGPDDRSQAKAIPGGDLRDPHPLFESEFLAARGNEIVTISDKGVGKPLFKSGMMVHEPRLIASRRREPVIPSRVDLAKTNGTLLLSDVYIGRNLKGVKPGSIKKLLVMEQLPKPVNFHGGGTTPLAHGGKWTLNRILGTVDVEPDGSASFEVPACRSIYLAALDENNLSVKQMRSFLTVMPGEHASCIGCHEDRTMALPAGIPLAAKRPPGKIEPIAGVPEIIDFPRDVQPVLDRRCVSCHNPDKREGGVDLCGDHGTTYSISYYNLMLHRQIKDTAGLDWEGARNVGGRPAGNDAPYEAFSSAAPLLKIMDGSHYDVKLTDNERTLIRLWLDSATPYAGTYAAFGTGQIGGWWRSNEPTREMANEWPSTKPAADAINRRCAACHPHGTMASFVTDTSVNSGDGHGDFEGWCRPVFRLSRHHIFNLTRPEQSLALKAVLAKSAGGYAEGAPKDPKPVAIDLAHAPKPFTHPVVFDNTKDADYQAILAHLQAAKTRLDEIKRFDMPGFKPCPEYVREMKRDGVLSSDFDVSKDSVNVYEVERLYWQLFWPKPVSFGGTAKR